jgi:ABC-type molybdenum transport system ATPase subunit/photorepair protein PhrA
MSLRVTAEKHNGHVTVNVLGTSAETAAARSYLQKNYGLVSKNVDHPQDCNEPDRFRVMTGLKPNALAREVEAHIKTTI